MADFNIGGSFHKAHRSLLRIIPLVSPRRLFAERDSLGWVTLPTMPAGAQYINMQACKQASFKVDDNEREFRLFGDEGWSDSVTTGSKISSQIETFFMKNIEVEDDNTPVFRGEYSEDFAIIERTRGDKEFEVYIEFLKEMGRRNGGSGNFIYDYCGFNCALRQYGENPTPEDLTNISLQAMGRGRPVFGKYDAGSSPINYSAIQSSMLSTAPSSGLRRYTVTPADNADDVVVSADITIAYTDGTDPLTQLALGAADGSGFRLERASTGLKIPAAVSLASGTVTINPSSNLPAGTILRLSVVDGAITQAVDASGVALSGGVRRPLAGFSTSFRTAA